MIEIEAMEVVLGAESHWQAREFVAQAGDIAPFPESVLKLLQLIRDPDAPMAEVVGVVQGDAVLSAKLLQLCNSGAMSLKEKVSSVQHAVVFLGLEEVQRATMAIGAKGTMARALRNYNLEARDFWQHCVVTAHAAAQLAAKNDVLYIPPSVAYTAGLLHDIGKLVIDRAITRDNRTAVEIFAKNHGVSIAEGERHVLGASHAETGGCLLRKWGLPNVLVEAVENHHSPVCQPAPELSTVVHLANILSRHLQSKAEGEIVLGAAALEAASALGLDANDLSKEFSALQKRMEKLAKFSAA